MPSDHHDAEAPLELGCRAAHGRLSGGSEAWVLANDVEPTSYTHMCVLASLPLCLEWPPDVCDWRRIFRNAIAQKVRSEICVAQPALSWASAPHRCHGFARGRQKRSPICALLIGRTASSCQCGRQARKSVPRYAWIPPGRRKRSLICVVRPARAQTPGPPSASSTGGCRRKRSPICADGPPTISRPSPSQGP
jgi:hypothetical protein